MPYFRRPRTTQERRTTQCRDHIFGHGWLRIKVRSKRNAKNLPNSYDDLSFSYWGHRSWKRHRHTQWKQE